MLKLTWPLYLAKREFVIWSESSTRHVQAVLQWEPLEGAEQNANIDQTGTGCCLNDIESAQFYLLKSGAIGWGLQATPYIKQRSLQRVLGAISTIKQFYTLLYL